MAKNKHEKHVGGPISWMANNSVASNLLMTVLLVGGLLGLGRVKQEVFPEFDLDMVMVQVPYPGASPAEVEQGILLAVEEAVRGVEGVKYVRSTASESMGSVNVELLLGADHDKVLADVKSAVDRITSFPEDAERPTVSLLSRRRQVISLIISGDQELRTLQAIGEKARSELLELPDITQVDLVGVRPLEVAIEIPQEKLEAYGLSLDEVARQVAAASVELPGGGVKTRGGELLVRVSDRRRFAHEFSSIILRGTAQGAQVRLGDIATLEDGYAETDQASYFNGKPAVRLTSYRVGDETPIEVASAVRAYAERLRAELPSNISVDIWADDSEVLAARIDLLMRNAQTGLLLVFLVLALFLQLRLAFWVALGIPISFLGAFLLMPALGLSINMVTLFAFIIVLGMVVDDAIVVGENIYARMEAGEGLMEAAIKGSKEMAVPVTFSILTTVAAFSPLFFVPGVTGKIFGLIPWVVVTVLLISLVEAFFILPAHLGHGAPGQKKGLALAVHRAQQRVSNGLNRFGERVYRPVLEVTLRHRYVTLCAAVAMLLMTVGMVASGRVPFTFFPKLEGDVVKATARLPYGAPLERTLAVRESLEASARAALAESGGERILRGMFTRVGESDSGEVGSHLVTVELNLVPGEEREVGAEALAAAWSRLTPPQAGLESLTFNSSVGPGAGRPVDVQLSHPDTEVLARASASLTETLRAFPALRDVENAYSQGKPQLDFRLLPQARTLGLTAGEVGRQLRSSFFGAEALREQRGRNEVKVMVRLPESQRRSEFDVERLLIRTPAGGRVPLSYVASFERGRSPTVIRREDGMRVVNVSAELAAGAKSPQEVLDSLKAEVLPKLKAEFPRLQADLVGQQRAQAETFGSLGQNFLLALLAIYALLAIPFRSYIQPLIIMSAIPFGFVGAVGGHILMGYGMSVISMLGVVALSGVVVNDSLVLIDATNGYRAQGHGAWESIVTGGVRRLRPILLTSLTTFFGLAPMILETSVQARFLIPMAISLGFGVLFATGVILVLVPSLYLIVEDVRGVLGLGEKVEPAQVAPAEAGSEVVGAPAP